VVYRIEKQVYQTEEELYNLIRLDKNDTTNYQSDRLEDIAGHINNHNDIDYNLSNMNLSLTEFISLAVNLKKIGRGKVIA